MQERELCQEIPKLKSPWSVSQVTLNLEQQQVDVFVEHPSGTKFCCPECSETLPCNDHTSERQWWHLDSCQFKTLLLARIPRVNCPHHGVKQVQVAWAAMGRRFTILFERFAIQVLLATQTVTGAMSILRTKWGRHGRLCNVPLRGAKNEKNLRLCLDWGSTRRHTSRDKATSLCSIIRT
jgi:transposase